MDPIVSYLLLVSSIFHLRVCGPFLQRINLNTNLLCSPTKHNIGLRSLHNAVVTTVTMNLEQEGLQQASNVTSDDHHIQQLAKA